MNFVDYKRKQAVFKKICMKTEQYLLKNEYCGKTKFENILDFEWFILAINSFDFSFFENRVSVSEMELKRTCDEGTSPKI